MFDSVPTAAPPAEIGVPPRPALAPGDGVVQGAGAFYHIEDTTGRGRRLFEGWASATGIDWEEEDYPPEVFEQAAQAYLRRNPVVLWDHQRDYPIARCLSAHVDRDKGLFVRGEVLRASDFGVNTNTHNMAILTKADEVWSLVKAGLVRGLSWEGTAAKRWAWSPELGKYIKQAVRVNMKEITLTAIQVHPNAKITGFNTVAKALNFGPQAANSKEIPTMDPIQAAQEAQQAYLQSLSNLPDGCELPQDMLEREEAVSKALGLSRGNTTAPDDTGGSAASSATTAPASTTSDTTLDEGRTAEIEEAVSKALATQNAAFEKKLESLLGKPAPLNRRVSAQGNAPSAAQAKPTDAPESVFEEAVSKALVIGSKSVNGVAELGEGWRHDASAEDLMKMTLHGAARRGRVKFGEYSLSAGGYQLMQHVMQSQQ